MRDFNRIGINIWKKQQETPEGHLLFKTTGRLHLLTGPATTSPAAGYIEEVRGQEEQAQLSCKGWTARLALTWPPLL